MVAAEIVWPDEEDEIESSGEYVSVFSPSAHPLFTSFFPISMSHSIQDGLGENLRASGSLAGN